MEGSESLGNAIPFYIQDLMKIMKSNDERMHILEENNKKIIKTIPQLSPSSNDIPFHLQPAGNTSIGDTLIQNRNGENTSNVSNPILSVTTGVTNTINTEIPTTHTFISFIGKHIATKSQPGASFLVTQPTETQGFVTKEELQRLDGDLKLREFSKSLTNKACTLYVNLKPSFVESWNQMCVIFGEKFFSTQDKVSFVDLGKEYQRPKKDFMN
ncbi:hypothetical protein Gotur_001819, partial [Gossypium turneri]